MGNQSDSDPKRLWLDGCFDGFHFAHANAVRQSLALVPNPLIIVGVHSDAQITKNKGPPLFDERERYELIRGCRWVYEVVEDVPYVTQLDVIMEHGIDFVVHGDDPVTDADGNDCYAIVKAAGKYMECKRTEGISTTSMITRILSQNPSLPNTPEDQHRLFALLSEFASSTSPGPLPIVDLASDFRTVDLPFNVLAGSRTVVFINSSWDCFSSGHVELLRRARGVAADVFLVVGVWSDEDVRLHHGEGPLLLMAERALAVAQCRYTDAVVLRPSLSSLPSESVVSVDLIVNPSPLLLTTLNKVEIPIPELQTMVSLREKILERKSEFEERQRRKGG